MSNPHAAYWCIRTTRKIVVVDKLTKKTENVDFQTRNSNRIGESTGLLVSTMSICLENNNGIVCIFL